MYSLYKVNSNIGATGAISMSLWREDGYIRTEYDARPKLGKALRIGDINLYQDDWWQATTVTEILEESENYVKFRTGREIYEWKIV